MSTMPRHLILSAALAAALFTGAAQAQDTTADAEIVASASVPSERLAERYADLAGSPEAAAGLVTQLRSGDDFVVVEEVATTITNDDGTTTTETALVERTVVNPNGPMGYGEVNITLAMAQALVDGGAYPDLASALSGTSTTVTNPDGTTSTVVEGGVLAMRADGMGWGQIAQELGYNLGSLVSASNNGGKVNGSVDAGTRAKVAGVKAERAVKAERVAKAERVDRPERPLRPEKIDRPERPQRPERGGR